MCMIEDSDGPVVLLSESQPVARTRHQCSECRRVIDPGERYLREFCLFDGRVTTHKTCAQCQVARNWLSDHCRGWCYGAVEEDVRKHAHEGYPMYVARLAIGMQWMWRTPRGKLMPVPKLPEIY